MSASATISTILSNTLNIVEEERAEKISFTSEIASASSILLQAKRFQNTLNQQQNIFQSTKSPEITPFHSQILHSQICDNPRLSSLMNSNNGRKTKAAKAHVTITKAKRIRMEKGEAYKDKANERMSQQFSKKAHKDRLKKL